MILKRSACLALWLIAGPTTAQTPPPSLTIGGQAVDVPATATGPMLPLDARQAISMGLSAAERRDWATVRGYMNVASEPLVRKVLLWRLATGAGDPASFSELDAALSTLEGWPMRTTMRQRAEAKIEGSGMSAAAIAAWLQQPSPGTGTDFPLTGEGKIALASALVAQGRTADAQPIIRDAWRTARVETTLQAATLQRFGSMLTPQDHAARVDMLLWADRKAQARALTDLLSPRDRDIALHRLGLAGGQSEILDSELQRQPGVLYERVKRLRQGNSRAEALQLLQQIDSRGLPETALDPLYTERRQLMIDALQARDYRAAYTIASGHGYSRGERFADGEFLAGWTALRFLNDNAAAERHFQTLANGVFTAVSKARAHYWLGRTAEARGDRSLALERYRLAAEHPTTYYGQLAAVAADKNARLVLPDIAPPSSADREKFENRELVQVIRLLDRAGEVDLFRQFALHLDEDLETEGEHQLLSDLARSLGEPAVAVRTAKAGIARGVIATEAAFPVMNVPRIVGYPQAEDALTLAIARQESEFNPQARSPAGALGLMQFMPATANQQARKMGLEHSTARLTADPVHALTLGAAHLWDLTNQFDGSYILAAIGYNAGPGRARQWINTYGDPRSPAIDAIDWVEMIPITETRNYVQRILENVQVYRTRLAGSPQPIRIVEDLNRGTRALSAVNPNDPVAR